MVYARVVVAHMDLETEIVCVSQRDLSDGFGVLEDGLMARISLGLAGKWTFSLKKIFFFYS